MELTEKEIKKVLEVIISKEVDIGELVYWEEDWELNRDNHFEKNIYVKNNYNSGIEKEHQLTQDEYCLITRARKWYWGNQE